MRVFPPQRYPVLTCSPMNRGEGCADGAEDQVQAAGAVIYLRGASPLEYKRPLSAVVADLPCAIGAGHASEPMLALSHPLLSGLLRGATATPRAGRSLPQSG